MNMPGMLPRSSGLSHGGAGVYLVTKERMYRSLRYLKRTFSLKFDVFTLSILSMKSILESANFVCFYEASVPDN